MSRHPYTVAIDPPGASGRRWRCEACRQMGTLAELGAKECPMPNAPVEHAHEIDAILAGAKRS